MWIYQDAEFQDEQIGTHQGYVYVITHIPSGRYYYGQKRFWFTKTLPPLRGQKRKRKKVVESDWRTYFGSSDELNALVERVGQEEFRREILYLCKTKSEMNFIEAYLQITRNVLFDPLSFNRIVNMRVSTRHVEKSEICRTLYTTVR